MFVVRPVEQKDGAALAALTSMATSGVHTLPKGRAAIDAAIERSLASFGADVDGPDAEAYLFVLESQDDGALHGTAAIAALAGSNGMFFAFRNDVIQQVSRDLDIRHSVHALTLCSDLTGHSQLSSFFIERGRSAGVEAALLSRARLLYAAGAPQRFNDKFFVSLAGITDAAGRSPFWEALGRQFFQMDFLAAERAIAGARNRSLIVELMPHYPVYVPLLPDEAKDVMGQVHFEGELPLALLSAEGFSPDDFIDIFDGGAILQAHKMALRSFNASVRRTVAEFDAQAEEDARARGAARLTHLVATTGPMPFRAIVVESHTAGMALGLSAEQRGALGVRCRDAVLTVTV